MPGPAPKPPRLVRWSSGPGRPAQWYVFFTDPETGKAHRRTVASYRVNPADEKARADLLRSLRLREKEQVEVREGLRPRDAFQTPLIDALDLFLADVDAREGARRANPHSREGLSRAAAYNLRLCVGAFKAWAAPKGLTCQDLDGPTLAAFFTELSASRAHKPATANLYRDKLKACLRWLDSRRPRLFPDSAIFWRALRAMPVQPRQGVAYAPKRLRKFARKCGPKLRRLFLLIALTGCRRKEAINIRWSDVDLERGRITIHATKTGRTRIVPLTGAPEGEIAPGLAAAIRKWPRVNDRLCGFRVYPRKRWEQVQRKVNVTPQGLRRNFVSYAASMGIPATVAALWTGHSAAVAERHYRQQVLERLPATSLEAAMGLHDVGVLCKRQNRI